VQENKIVTINTVNNSLMMGFLCVTYASFESEKKHFPLQTRYWTLE